MASKTKNVKRPENMQHKLVLSFDMLAGRLELIPMLMIFVPSVWSVKRKKK